MLTRPLTAIEDDTEDAPWMVMGSAQFWATTRFAEALENELASREPPLFVTGMLPIRYYPIPAGKEEKLSPDVLVARVPVYDRGSYDLEREGVAPAFVLEVVSPESYNRYLAVKPTRYERMGVEEYARFAPRMSGGSLLMDPPLQGHRREPLTGKFVPWETDASGRLYSEVLELWLVVHDGELRAQRWDGSLVQTPRELIAEVARLRSALEEQET